MRTSTLSVITLLALLAGCANNPDTSAIHGVSADQAARLNSGRTAPDDVRDVPFTADTRFAAGQMAEAQGNPAAALAQYQEAIKLKPDHQGALYRLGVLYAEVKQYADAVDAWTTYVKATGGSPSAFSNLGFCQELAGDPGKAESAYLQGIAKDPRNVPCRVNYGLMLARRGRTNEAVRQWQAVLTEAEIHYNLGSVYEMQGRKEQAKIEYNKAIDLDPKLTDAKNRMAALD